MIILGVGMLILGIAYHLQFMKGLRQERPHMVADSLCTVSRLIRSR